MSRLRAGRLWITSAVVESNESSCRADPDDDEAAITVDVYVSVLCVIPAAHSQKGGGRRTQFLFLQDFRVSVVRGCEFVGFVCTLDEQMDEQTDVQTNSVHWGMLS
jgi:hypothetical protein